MLPDPLFEPGDEETLEAGESEGEEGEERDGREDSSQEARQLVKTAMKEAERGTNSDEEDPMEFEEGGASEKVGGASKENTKYRGGEGINSLFNLGAGVLRHGPVDLTPGFSVGKLLEPVTESEVETNARDLLKTHLAATAQQSDSDSKLSFLSTESVGKCLSLDGYLVLVKMELGFSDCDIEYAKVLYSIVSSAGKSGIARKMLKTRPSLSGLKHHMSLDEHTQTLINFEMVRLLLSLPHKI